MAASPAPVPTRAVGFRVTLSSLLFVELFSGVLQIYFVPLYPSLADRFGIDAGTVSWALIVFTLSTAVFTPLFARLGDVYGHRRILRLLVGLVAAGCVLIAAAPNFGVLIVGRVLQGMFPAYLPLMFGVVRARYPGEATRRGIAYLSGILLFGVLAGSVATGLLVHAAGGPTWALWVPAIGTLIGFVLLWLIPGAAFVRTTETRVDWTGVALIGAGLACLLLGLSQGPDWGWGSGRILGLLVAGVVLLVIWVAVELRTPEPMVDLRFVFRGRLLPVYVVAIGVYFGMIGDQVANSTFMALPGDKLGYGLGLGALGISLALVPGLACGAVAAALTSRIGRAISYPWTMATGAIVVFLGFVGLVFFHANVAEFVVCGTVGFAGMGFIEGSTRTIVVDNIRREETSMGSGIYELSTTVGGAVGAAVLTMVLTANTSTTSHVVSATGFEIVWIVGAVLALVSAVAAVGFAVRVGRHHTAPEADIPTGTQAVGSGNTQEIAQA